MTICAVTRDLNAYQGRVDEEAAYDAAIEREIDSFMDLSVRELWSMCPDNRNGSLSDRFSELLNELAELELERRKSDAWEHRLDL